MRWVDKKKRWRPRQRLPRHLLTSQAEPWNAKDPSIKKKRPADKWPSVSGIHNNSTHTKRTKKNKLWWKRRSTQTRRTCGPFFFCLFFSFFFWLSGNEENQWKVQWKSKKKSIERTKERISIHPPTNGQDIGLPRWESIRMDHDVIAFEWNRFYRVIESRSVVLLFTNESPFERPLQQLVYRVFTQ